MNLGKGGNLDVGGGGQDGDLILRDTNGQTAIPLG
jgi:hypothetical protein